jgi:hypothetical protein
MVQAQEMGKQHPIYRRVLEPNVAWVQARGAEIWNGPVRPILNRVDRTLRKIYLKYIQPRMPYFKARLYAVTAPYTQRISGLHQQYLAPHVYTAQGFAQVAGKNAVNNYRYVQSHPLTGQAGKIANRALQQGKKRGTQLYQYSRPHVVRGGKEAERIAREILGPRAVRGLQIAAAEAERRWEVIKS